MKYILTGVLSSLVFFVCGQNSIPNYQSNPSLSFSSFRTGIKMAYVAFEEEQSSYLIEHPESAQGQALYGILLYLKDNGYEEVQWGSISNKPNDVPSLCEVVLVKPEWRFEKDMFFDFRISYVSCNNDVFSFEADKPIHAFDHTAVKTAFYKTLQRMYGFKKAKFAFNYCLMLPSEMSKWNDEKIKSSILENGAANFDGIYECLTENASGQKLKVGVVRSNENYDIIYLEGAENYLDWTEGEIQARLTSTASSSLFKSTWKANDKSKNLEPYISFENGLMNLIYAQGEKKIFIKLFPSVSDNMRAKNNGVITGTGFAVSANGLIATNYHVVKDAKSVVIRGLGGDASSSYKAEVVVEDRNNDLAILQINDNSFKSLEGIPYKLSTRVGEVGSSVFVLGYPLPKSMGPEIKLTNGLISSNSGFQGDVTSYQISAPVQPGNSGGPVFDESGNILGIVSSKHGSAEQASYAVKASYLANLFEIIPQQVNLPESNSVAGKPLPDQVRKLKNYICIVEVN